MLLFPKVAKRWSGHCYMKLKKKQLLPNPKSHFDVPLEVRKRLGAVGYKSKEYPIYKLRYLAHLSLALFP